MCYLFEMYEKKGLDATLSDEESSSDSDYENFERALIKKVSRKNCWLYLEKKKLKLLI